MEKTTGIHSLLGSCECYYRDQLLDFLLVLKTHDDSSDLRPGNIGILVY